MNSKELYPDLTPFQLEIIELEDQARDLLYEEMDQWTDDYFDSTFDFDAGVQHYIRELLKKKYNLVDAPEKQGYDW